MEKMLATLIANGIDPVLAESMIKSFKPKTEKVKKGNGFFQKKPKTVIQVSVTVICECCGAHDVQIKDVETTDPGSPTEMKLPVSCCNQCPDYFRALTHEQLVSLALAAHNPGIKHSHPRTSSQVKLAKRLSPEEMLTYHLKTV